MDTWRTVEFPCGDPDRVLLVEPEEVEECEEGRGQMREIAQWRHLLAQWNAVAKRAAA